MLFKTAPIWEHLLSHSSLIIILADQPTQVASHFNKEHYR